MERIFRKLQALGGSYVISLPRNWVRNFNLEEKKALAIDIRSDGSLIISPKLEQSEEDLKDELVLHSSPYVGRELVKNCLSGQTNLVIISDKEIDKKLKNEIRWLVNGLPNTEITEEQRQRIVIQNFGYKQIPTKKLIQRLLYLIADMFDYLKEGSIEELKYNFIQLRKFYFILVTHIRTYLRTGVYVSEDQDFTPLEAMDIRMFCEKIQEIGKILRDLRLSENVMEFFNEIHQYFNNVMNAYLKKDLIMAHKSWLKKDKLVEKGRSLNNGLDYDDKVKIKDMIRIAENCKDMAAFI
jgi:antitoxin component of MazEF toxin-antitoxin module